jgi:uncharacterized membrane protein YdjX (TVP38/TMEM64 family)
MARQRRIIPKEMQRIVIPTAIILGLTVVVVLLNWNTITGFFQNPDEIKSVVREAGPWGPIVFMAVQFLQILIAPIPGQAVGFLAGALFGPWLGLLYSMIGAVFGFTTVFVLSKLLGRPFVERFVKKEDLTRFDRLTKNAGPLVLFLIFLLPGFPDDAICYIAGLSALPIRTLVFVSIAGRLPGYLATSFIGAGIGGSSLNYIVVTVVGIGFIAVVAYLKRAAIKQFIQGYLDTDKEEEQ